MGDFDILGLIDGLRELFQEFNAGIFLGFAAICYLIIQLFRGKAGFKIPFVTKWFEGLSKEVKTYILLGLFGVAGALTSLGADEVTFWTVLDGLLAGIAAGVGTIGTRNVVKQGIEGIGSLKKKVKEQNDK